MKKYKTNSYIGAIQRILPIGFLNIYIYMIFGTKFGQFNIKLQYANVRRLDMSSGDQVIVFATVEQPFFNFQSLWLKTVTAGKSEETTNKMNLLRWAESCHLYISPIHWLGDG